MQSLIQCVIVLVRSSKRSPPPQKNNNKVWKKNLKHPGNYYTQKCLIRSTTRLFFIFYLFSSVSTFLHNILNRLFTSLMQCIRINISFKMYDFYISLA